MSDPGTHEHRIARLETLCDKHGFALGELSKEHAVTREALRIFEYAQADLRESLSQHGCAINDVKALLAQHATDETKDRARLLTGVITAALSSLSTIAVLIWGVWQVIHDLPQLPK